MQRACFSRLDCCNLPSAIVPKAVEFALRLSHIGRQLTLAPVVHISERDGSHNLARRHRRRGSFSAGVGSQIFQENTRRKPTADAGTFQVSGLVEKNKPHADAGSSCITKSKSAPVRSFRQVSKKKVSIDFGRAHAVCGGAGTTNLYCPRGPRPDPRSAFLASAGRQFRSPVFVCCARTHRRTTRESARRTPLGTTRAPAYYLSVLRALLHRLSGPDYPPRV